MTRVPRSFPSILRCMVTKALAACALALLAVGVAAQNPVVNAALLYEKGEWEQALAVVRGELANGTADARLRSIGAWCLLNIAERDRDAAPAQEAVRWLEDGDGSSVGAPDLGLAMGYRILAETCEDADTRRTFVDRGLARVEANADDAVRGAQHAAWTGERVRLQLLRAGPVRATRIWEDAQPAFDRRRAALTDRIAAQGSDESRTGHLEEHLLDMDAERAGIAAGFARRLREVERFDLARRVLEPLLDLGPGIGSDDATLRTILEELPDDPRLAPACVLALRRTEDTGMRAGLADALGRVGAGCEAAKPALLATLTDPNPRVVGAAVTALGLLGELDDATWQAIETLRDHEDREVRERVEAVLRSPRKFELAFVLVSEPALPDAERLVEIAGRLGVRLVLHKARAESQRYAIEGGPELIVSLMRMPHPDAADMRGGLTSPPRKEAAAAPAHYMVTVLDPVGSRRQRDVLLAKVTAAVVRSSPAVGAMFGRGAVFHRPEVWTLVTAEHDARSLPVPVCVDVTFASEDKGRISLLTHGMRAYGREEILLYAPGNEPEDAAAFLMPLVEWLLAEPDVRLETGETVGPSVDVKIPIERGPSPVDEKETVIVLRLG